MESLTPEPPPILTLKSYLKGRDTTHSSECLDSIIKNAEDLIRRVNFLLDELKITQVYVNSGWRPASINASVGGKPHSHHLTGKAVDLADPTGILAELIVDQAPLLKEFGLWMEDPEKTKGWVHLDTGERPARLIQIFGP